MASIDASGPATTPAPAARPGSRAAAGEAPGEQPDSNMGVWLVCSLGVVIWVGLLAICMFIAHASGEQSSSRKARPHQEPEKSASALRESAPVLLFCGRNAGRGHAGRGRGAPRVGPQRIGAPVESAIAEGAWMRDGRAYFADALEERHPRKGALLKPPVSGLATAMATAKSHVCRTVGTKELYIVVRVGRTDTARRPARARVYLKGTPRK